MCCEWADMSINLLKEFACSVRTALSRSACSVCWVLQVCCLRSVSGATTSF